MAIKILKLGWEFPPNSWGGLGVACYGLTQGLSNNGATVSLVLPHEQITDIKKCKILCAPVDLHKNFVLRQASAYAEASADRQDERKETSEKNVVNKFSKNKVYKNLYTDIFSKVSRYAKNCQNVALTQDFDVIHAHDWLTFKAGMKIKKLTKKPLFVHVHSIEFDRCGEKKGCKKIIDIEKKGMQVADCIMAVSNCTKERIIKYYDISADKIFVVHNAISSKSVDNHPEREQEFSSKTKPKVLFLGRLTVQKGPEYFLKAAHKILQQKDNIEFVIAGSGDMKNKLVRLTKKLGIEESVTFTGFLQGEEIDNMYRQADVYVMPSVYEPFGLTPLEAMRNGVPVIVSKCAGVCEIIKNCFKVDFWNTDDIAQKVLCLLNNSKLREDFSVNGKKEVSKFSWDNAAEKCIKIYKNWLEV